MEKKTLFEKELNLKWTGGEGNYFDGAGELNVLLMKLYNCGSCSSPTEGNKGIPFSTDIMGDIKPGARVKMTIKLEIEEEE